MKHLSMTLAISAIGLAVVLASPAEAAKKSTKHKRSTAYAVQHRQTANALPQTGAGYQGGVLKGPLYNGPDYIGDDPDPNIRARLMKDMTRYQGSY